MSSHDGQVPNCAWPEPGQYRRSMRLEFSLYVSAMILVLMTVTGYIFTQRYVATVTEGIVDNLLTQARSYAQTAGKPIIAGERPDALMLNTICTRLKASNPSIYWAGVYGADSTVLGHTDVSQLSSGGSLLRHSSGEFSDRIGYDEALDLTPDTIYARVPITEQGIVIGHLQLASSAGWISEVRGESIATVAIITLFMLALGIPATMVMMSRKLRPVKLITNSLHNVDMETFTIDPPVHKSNELGFLAETLRVMGRRLQSAQLDRVEKERRDRELEIARDIQRNILPRSLPRTDLYEFAVTYHSAREVGGDYYDIIDLGDGKTAFIIADVSGKSLPGMLVMLMTRDITRNCLTKEREPAVVLSTINRELKPSLHSGMFVTMFYGLVDTQAHSLTFASAGHNPLIRISADGSDHSQHKTKGYPLGLMSPENFDKRIETGNIELVPGDWIIQYTDGLNEAQNSASEEFGMERFLDALKRNTASLPNDFISGVMNTHSEFVAEAEPFDDITLLALKWHGQSKYKSQRPIGEAIHAQ